MRGLFILTVIVGLLWVIDAFAFGGRYHQAVWQEASFQGQKVSYQVRRWLNKAGL